MASSFESKQDAKETRDNEMAAELAGKRKLDHTGRFVNSTWNCNGLKAEVQGYESKLDCPYQTVSNKK